MTSSAWGKALVMMWPAGASSHSLQIPTGVGVWRAGWWALSDKVQFPGGSGQHSHMGSMTSMRPWSSSTTGHCKGPSRAGLAGATKTMLMWSGTSQPGGCGIIQDL